MDAIVIGVVAVDESYDGEKIVPLDIEPEVKLPDVIPVAVIVPADNP